MSALEQSVTLEDVFAVVNGKRVPLAPELAGYLSLEIAEGSNASEGDVDPKTVFIGEEGSVALVRPKRENASGSAEASVRVILARLLEASGSQTPALGAAARRKPGAGLPALVEELEAALIPVNRAAGRRALARLAREVKRVTLGVGRNASVPQRAEREPGPHPGAVPSARAAPAPTRASPPPVRAEPLPITPPPPQVLSVEPFPASPLPRPAMEIPVVAPANTPEPEPARTESFPDPELLPRGVPSNPPPPEEGPSIGASQGEVLAKALPGPDEVDNLLAGFEVSGNTTDRAVSRELKAMVGLEPTPPPPSAPSPADREIEQLLALTDLSVPIANVRRSPLPEPPPPAAPSPASPRRIEEIPPVPERASALAPRALPPPPAQRKDPPAGAVASPRVAPPPPAVPTSLGVPAAREFRKPRAPKVDRILTVLTLLVLLGGAVALWMLKPGFFTGRTPERIEQERKAAASAQALAAEPPVRCRATLLISDVPARAEVLLHQGQAPVDVERMPVGARLEFVATAEGYAPRRTVVPTGAAWDNGPDGKPRFEVAVQLDPSKIKPAPDGASPATGGTHPTLVDAWPAGEPGTHVGGSGPPGTVRIVSTPRGAEVWLLVGAAPAATIDPIKCDADTEVLIAGPTSFRKRLHVTAAEVMAAPPGDAGAPVAGGHVVRLSAK